MRFLALLLIAFGLFAKEMVIYNDEALVSEEVTLQNFQAPLPECVDSASVYVEGGAFWLKSASSLEDILRSFVGKEISFLAGKRLKRGKLLSLSPLMIESNGSIYFNIKPTDIVIKSLPKDYTKTLMLYAPNRKRAKVRYICQGVRWESIYHLDLSDRLYIKGFIHITSPQKFLDIKLKVVAGKNQERPVYLRAEMAAPMMKVEPKKVRGLYIYMLPGRWDIDKESFLPYLEAQVSYEERYQAELFNLRFASGKIKRKFRRTISFWAPKPLPKGKVYIYDEDILLSSDSIANEPKGSKVTLDIGEDFDRVVEREVIRRKEDKKRLEIEVVYRLSNPKPKEIEVEIIEHIPTSKLFVEGGCQVEVINASSLKITAKLPQGQKSCRLRYLLQK